MAGWKGLSDLNGEAWHAFVETFGTKSRQLGSFLDL